MLPWLWAASEYCVPMMTTRWDVSVIPQHMGAVTTTTCEGRAEGEKLVHRAPEAPCSFHDRVSQHMNAISTMSRDL